MRSGERVRREAELVQRLEAIWSLMRTIRLRGDCSQCPKMQSIVFVYHDAVVAMMKRTYPRSAVDVRLGSLALEYCGQRMLYQYPRHERRQNLPRIPRSIYRKHYEDVCMMIPFLLCFRLVHRLFRFQTRSTSSVKSEMSPQRATLLLLWSVEGCTDKVGCSSKFDTDNTFDFGQQLLVWNGSSGLKIGNLVLALLAAKALMSCRGIVRRDDIVQDQRKQIPMFA